MEELLEKIPPEKCWEITSKILWRFLSLGGRGSIEVITGKDEGVIAPVLAWDKYQEINEKIFGDGGRQMFLWAKETFSLPVENAIDAAKLVTVVGALMQGPEYTTELVEATPEKVILRTINCVLWDIEKEYEVDPELWVPSCIKISQVWGEKGLKAINPKIKYKMTKSLSRGEPYCEAIIEFKDE
ncbi:MAG: hypothetical protein KAI34_08040 [Candidatus Lokiarchaeota archaeon]|nr:hypothetical protein [Candidatus Lokiarchaeota archaeon]